MSSFSLEACRQGTCSLRAALPREETPLTAASLAASVCAGAKEAGVSGHKMRDDCGKGKERLTLGCIAFCMFLTAGVGGVVCDK